MDRSRSPRVMIDTSLLLIARTGIRTYILELVEGAQSHPKLKSRYLIPAYRWFRQVRFFHGRMNWGKKVLFHSFYFFWKHIVLPGLALIRRADIILVPDYIAPIVPTGKLVVIVFHDVFYWERKDSYHPVWRRWMLGLVHLGMRANRHELVATSTYTAQKVREYVPSLRSISVIYQCPRTIKVDNASALDTSNFFLHVGTLEKRKNLKVLLEAYSLFRREGWGDNPLVLVGGPSPSTLLNVEEELRQMISALALEGEVIMTGYVPEADIPAYFEQAFAYLFPSLDEGFGIPLVEAMQHRVPTIIAASGSLPEISDGSSLLWVDGEVGSLARLMHKVKDDDLREALIEKGAKRAATFSREQFVKDFDDFLAENHSGA